MDVYHQPDRACGSMDHEWWKSSVETAHEKKGYEQDSAKDGYSGF